MVTQLRTRAKIELTAKRLNELLSYNQRTGLLTWQTDRGRLAKKGDEAGSVHSNGTVVVGIDGILWTAGQIIWCMVKGHWPDSKIRYRDGDRQNLRWNNLVTEADVYSTDHRAVYQRQRNRDLKLAMRSIQEDPELFEVYLNADPPRRLQLLNTAYREATDKRIRNYQDQRRLDDPDELGEVPFEDPGKLPPGWTRHDGGPNPTGPQFVEILMRDDRKRNDRANQFWWGRATDDFSAYGHTVRNPRLFTRSREIVGWRITSPRKGNANQFTLPERPACYTTP